MIVFVNAISTIEGGSLVVLRRLLEEMIPLRDDIVWHVAVGEKFPARDALESLGVTIWTIPWDGSSILGICRAYEWALPRLLHRTGADVLFSLTNYLPRRPIHVPQLLLVQHAGHFSTQFETLTEQVYPEFLARLAWRVKNDWVHASVRRASIVILQTHALSRAVTEQTGTPADKIAVVPHGPGLSRLGCPRRFPASTQWRIGYVTKYGVQKNFRILFLAVKKLMERGYDIRLVLTLESGLREYQRVVDEFTEAGIESCIENHGEIAQDRIEALYDTLDLFVFPSLCESFGFPILEAMARGLPTAMADTESNREIAGEGAIYFPPQDEVALANRLENWMKSRQAYDVAARWSISRAMTFSWPSAGRGTLGFLEKLTKERGLSAGRDSPSAAEKKAVQERTRQHYDSHPLDFMSARNDRLIGEVQPEPFREFVETLLVSEQRVADIGCGPGRATTYLLQKGMRVCAIDISSASLALARKRAPGAQYVCASNLALPMLDGSFDAVVSDGVIHHTPDAALAFRENARLLKAGGYMYLGVYRRFRYYYYIYTYIGIPIRWIARTRWGTRLLEVTLLPVYFLVHLAKSRGQRTWTGAKNFFHDYILTPQATFHTREQVEGWAIAAGMQLIRYEENVGNVHAFVLRKAQSLAEKR